MPPKFDPTSPAAMYADLMRQGFMKSAFAKKRKSVSRESVIVVPKHSERNWKQRGGLLADVMFKGRSGIIGKSQGSPPYLYYVTEQGFVVSEGHKTFGQAVKAFEKRTG